MCDSWTSFITRDVKRSIKLLMLPTVFLVRSALLCIFDPLQGGHVNKSLPPFPVMGGNAIGTKIPGYGSCIVSDELEFIFIKVAKSGSSTVLNGWLWPSLCPVLSPEDRYTGWGKTSFAKTCDPKIISPGPTGDTQNPLKPCTEIPQWKWNRYFVFTTVRNPYSRLLSAYRYCKVEEYLPWTEFCADPQRAGGCPAQDNGLHAYNQHYQVPVHWVYHGWWGWHVDFVIRVENMAEDIKTVAGIINRRTKISNTSLTLLNGAASVNVQKGLPSDKPLCSWYTGSNAVCKESLEATMNPHVLGYKNYCG